MFESPATLLSVKRSRLLALFLMVGVSTWSGLGSAPAQALPPQVRQVVVFGGYGLALGTAAGLVSVPLSQDWRTLFIGSAVGLYVGLGIGIFYVIAFDDPNNPFRAKPESVAALQVESGTGAETLQKQMPAPVVWVQVPVFHF